MGVVVAGRVLGPGVMTIAAELVAARQWVEEQQGAL